MHEVLGIPILTHHHRGQETSSQWLMKAVPIRGYDLPLYSGRLMEVLVVKHNLRVNEARLAELGSDPGQAGPDSAGQSGNTQGLSQEADAADESVEELADTDQPYEAGIAEGVEDAEDHPERPVRSHEDQGRTKDIRPNAIKLVDDNPPGRVDKG
jgi:hypothetical protein